MLKVLIPTIMLLLSTLLSPLTNMWSSTLLYSFIIALTSLSWISCSTTDSWNMTNTFLATDSLSLPLLILTCWLLPLMILASQKHISMEPLNRQRTYLILLISLQFFLILAFGATEATMFYIMFEATLLPTLILITRWGNQKERLNAGTYFLFYTLAGSLPLLVALLILHGSTGSLSFLTMNFFNPQGSLQFSYKLWWFGCVMAFLVKMPLYGVHLWLPKAHVEAPVAGSMVLAAVLLKLGGYGLMRIMVTLEPETKNMAYPFITLALWGMIMTGLICLRQTDLKSLIAYSSVSHMGLVAAGLLIQTTWGFSGALILMIAHGLTSSALFCLANTNYERTHTRTMLITRSLQAVFPLMTLWWFISSLANLALPPLPNLVGELMIISSLFNWSPFTLIFTGAGALITVSYSLYMFLTTQRGTPPSHMVLPNSSHTREHLLMLLHVAPLIMLTLKPELMWGPAL
uniref:NADH-ubiquinone oxidoreductase chain 4 n=1 Tax=Nothobranchius nubaensis TaxID=2607867 RepID=A0A518QNP5_9TELE|nr:NADH dehydrogenase subunit 4 [Nothobranchius nubaensis]QDX07401.1 NADH dehydrogenase subunit 4 [Nothobranchius nubaensis]